LQPDSERFHLQDPVGFHLQDSAWFHLQDRVNLHLQLVEKSQLQDSERFHLQDPCVIALPRFCAISFAARILCDFICKTGCHCIDEILCDFICKPISQTFLHLRHSVMEETGASEFSDGLGDTACLEVNPSFTLGTADKCVDHSHVGHSIFEWRG